MRQKKINMTELNLVSEALSGENDNKNYNSRYTELLNSDIQTIVNFFAVAQRNRF